MAASLQAPRPLGGPLLISAILHLSIAGAALWTLREGEHVPLPPVYRVNIVAAPPGERAIGVVNAEPAPPTPKPPATPTKTPSATKAPTPPASRDVAKSAPTLPSKSAPRAPSKSTPVPPTPAAETEDDGGAPPKAGGGPTGGEGADVANIDIEGIDFPYPGYLNNIVRQIALRFKPPNPNSPLRAEVAFLIQRNGKVTNFRFITRSGVYKFDLAAQGAVEAAGKEFGPLPQGFKDDVLPVVFSFDPNFWR